MLWNVCFVAIIFSCVPIAIKHSNALWWNSGSATEGSRSWQCWMIFMLQHSSTSTNCGKASGKLSLTLAMYSKVPVFPSIEWMNCDKQTYYVAGELFYYLSFFRHGNWHYICVTIGSASLALQEQKPWQCLCLLCDAQKWSSLLRRTPSWFWNV